MAYTPIRVVIVKCVVVTRSYSEEREVVGSTLENVRKCSGTAGAQQYCNFIGRRQAPFTQHNLQFIRNNVYLVHTVCSIIGTVLCVPCYVYRVMCTALCVPCYVYRVMCTVT